MGFSNSETEDTKMKQYEFMDWESDEWGDGDLSDMDVKLMQMGYAAPGGNDQDAVVADFFRSSNGGYHNAPPPSTV